MELYLLRIMIHLSLADSIGYWIQWPLHSCLHISVHLPVHLSFPLSLHLPLLEQIVEELGK